MTILIFRDDAYLTSCAAQTVAVNERGGVLLDRTVFYATSGGQPGDKGTLEFNGHTVAIATTVYDEQKDIVHVPAGTADLPTAGAPVTVTLDWDTRYKYMRAHTALHLLCALVRFPVTGGQIASDGGRLDFDIPDAGAVDRAQLESEINRLIRENHPVGATAIRGADLARKPELVRTMAVKPPAVAGQVRLVSIGEGGSIDLQPCGGTHVRSTGEIGTIAVGKLESKGRQNRRIRISFA